MVVLVVVLVGVVVFVVGLFVVVVGRNGGLLLGRNVTMGTRVGRGLNRDQKVVMPGGRKVGGHRVAVTSTLPATDVVGGAVLAAVLVDDVVLGLAEGLYVLLVVGRLVVVGVGDVGVR